MQNTILRGSAAATVGAFVLMAFASVAFAAPTVSEHADQAACFGQARASYAQHGPNGLLAPNSNGTYISERKGSNPEINAAYIAANCVL